MFAVEIEQLKKSYANNTVLNGTNLQLEKNAILGISGASGVGKTTLLRCIAGLEWIDSGLIKMNSQTVQSRSVYTPPYKRNLSMVFQHLALWPHKTVYQNVDYAAKSYIKSKAKRKDWIKFLLDVLKISHKTNELPGNLSGGEQQRAAIARALANRPKFLLLDEPLNNLNHALQKLFLVELQDLIHEFDMTVIIVSHESLLLQDYLTENRTLKDGILISVRL